MRHILPALVLMAIMVVFGGKAHAHDPGLSALTITAHREYVAYRWLVNNADLTPLRSAGERPCSGVGAVFARQDEGAVYIMGATCQSNGPDHTAFDGKLRWRATEPLEIDLTLLDELPRGHRTFAHMRNALGATIDQRVLRRGAASLRLPPGGLSLVSVIASPNFFVLGIEHIVRGLDHLLFLFLLLVGIRDWRRAAVVVSCFTLAHSITLAAATLGWIQLPSRLVESLIAGTVVYAAVRNFVSAQAQSEKVVTVLAFGLLHGLGFASALRGLAMTGDTPTLFESLFLFNAGVEAGQVALAVLAAPVLMALRRPLTRWRLDGTRAVSAVAAAVALAWFLERSLEL